MFFDNSISPPEVASRRAWLSTAVCVLAFRVGEAILHRELTRRDLRYCLEIVKWLINQQRRQILKTFKRSLTNLKSGSRTRLTSERSGSMTRRRSSTTN